MTGPLKNAKHEAFVRGLMENKTALQAYADAGYNADDANASRLSRNPKVAQRLAELQSEIAAETVVTIEGLINELEEARKKAADSKQFSASIKAVLGKAQLSGLLVEKKQVEVGGPGDFDGMTDPQQIALAVANHCFEFEIQPYHDFRDEDRERLAGLWQQCFDAFSKASEELIAEIRARPLKASFKPPKALPPPHTNGRNRY